jgi:predicted dehydrogenase
MRINFSGKLVDEPQIRAGVVGCGSHSFRNIYPVFQFAPVRLIATCDLDADRAAAFARQFGAERSYTQLSRMLQDERLDAVFIVTNYDEHGRPRYPQLAEQCLRAGCHVWMEKPPAATSAEIQQLQQLADDRVVMVGFKKMFFPANEKAQELICSPDFGRPSFAMLQYPQSIPTIEEFREYLHRRRSVPGVTGFLDHLCHPVSLMLFLLGMPTTLFYQRSDAGAGVAVFNYGSGAVATINLTAGAQRNGGMERLFIVSDRNRHLIVDNNIHVSYHRDPPHAPGTGYGTAPDFYTGTIDQTIAAWEPEFSLGQLYNKGLFLLGYFGEINEFARAILDARPPAKAHLRHALQATQIFEAFAEGPGKVIPLPGHDQEMPVR